MRAYLLIWACLALGGCRDSAFQAASQENTMQAWRRFIAAHPQDEEVEAAHARLSELAFASAQKLHTPLAYRRFLEEFPDAAEAGSAAALLEGLHFNGAAERNTVIAWRQFVAEHPLGAHRDEADVALAKLELTALGESADPQELEALVKKYPDDPRVEHARQMLDDAAWARSTEAEHWYAYLREFAAGRHRDQARAALLRLQIEGLLISGAVAEAKALIASAPLAASLPGLNERVAHAEELAKVAARCSSTCQSLPPYWLLPRVDLLASLKESRDPLMRWQAAEELGHWVSVQTIDPLLEQVRTARSPLTQQRAFDALAMVLRALPRPVASYEVATRLEATRNKADLQTVMTQAVLLDLTGQLEAAAQRYQQVLNDSRGDPVVLRRWAAVRLERRQFFSAAIAAGQLAGWAEQTVSSAAEPQPTTALASSRELCAAVEMAGVAVEILGVVAKEPSEFPDDVQRSWLKAKETQQLARARLRDAELALLAVDPHAPGCADVSVAERLREAETKRMAAVGALKKQHTTDQALVLELVRTLDPSPRVRSAAQ